MLVACERSVAALQRPLVIGAAIRCPSNSSGLRARQWCKMMVLMGSVSALSTPAHELLVEIARCPLAQACLSSETPHHPCSRIVFYQWPERPAADRLERWQHEHHMPEPWYGHLEQAPILFVSSNPSIRKPSSVPVADQPLPPLSRDGHPLRTRLGRAPTWRWEDQALEGWYEDAFDFRIHDGRKGLQADGTPKKATMYWSSVKKHAEQLIPSRQVRPGIDYALTEAVHCKSRQEDGVGDALQVCSKRYLLRVLEASASSLILVLGRHAKNAVRSCIKMAPEPHLEGPIRIGTKDRYFVFLPHPNAHQARSLSSCFSPDEINRLRQIIAAACS